MSEQLGYWFFGDTMRNGEPIPKDGVTSRLLGVQPIRLCSWGYHASKLPSRALLYAPGPNLALVRLSGRVIEGGDKMCAEERTILRRIDATELLLGFGREMYNRYGYWSPALVMSPSPAHWCINAIIWIVQEARVPVEDICNALDHRAFRAFGGWAQP